MKVLVTGGAGYIGSHMVHQLRDRGDDVSVIDDLSTGHRAAIPDDIELIVGDIGNSELVTAVLRRLRPDAIVHFAGSVVVPDSVINPLLYYLNNTVKSRTVIDAAVRTGVRNFVFSSSAAVYGIPKTNPVDETAPTDPASPYGASKLMTERMLMDVSSAHDFRFVALRYFNVAGADPQGRTGQSTPNATHLIKAACEAAIGKRNRLEIYGADYETPDGTGVRDYIHICDLTEAHVRALEHLAGGRPSRIYNCGYGHGFSVREVLDVVMRVAKRTFPVRIADRRAGDPPSLVADSKRLRIEQNWRPRYDDLELIATHALAWEKRLTSKQTDTGHEAGRFAERVI